jgi:two-component system, OmpR family, sensor histidine kinase KdpD
MEEKRDPDAILREIRSRQKSKLTIFLGAVAGVGKTYAMLQAAHERLADGTDVVIGWVDTHDRKETDALVTGLPLLPRGKIEYRGITLEELDLDMILERKPELVLVDELAHTNVPGSRHNRRFQDVSELLEAGISVYTTLNIQHIESLNDVVEQVTGVRVRETVPDAFVSKADLIQLIDIPADALIRRLEEGKVYMPQLAGEALSNFFRPGNINALRELALRFAAQRVDRELVEYRELHRIKSPWPAGEKVLACVGPSPYGIRVIRSARRLADSLKADLVVMHVENPLFKEREEDRVNLSANLKLATELGAEIVSVTDKDVARVILEEAVERNVTQIVLGHPLHSRLREWMKGNVVDRVITGSKGISVHVIPGEPEAPITVPAKRVKRVRYRTSVLDYVVIIALLVAVTILCKVTGNFFNLTDVAMLYLLPILYAGARAGLVTSICTSAVCVITFDLLFVPPLYRFTVADLHYITTFVVFLLVGITTGFIASRLRGQVTETNLAMARTRTLYDLSKELAAISEVGEFATTLTREVARAVASDTVFYMRDSDSQPQLFAASDDSSPIARDKAEKAVAIWAFEHGHEAGATTDTLPGSAGLFIPVKLDDTVLGVLGVQSSEEVERDSLEQKDLLVAISGLAALALDKLLLSLAAQHVRNLEESERLRNALFNSISHELRTPLSSIVGAVTSLTGDENLYSAEERAALLQTIEKGAMRMNRVVRNLLDMARLESGSFHLNAEWCDLQDVVGVATAEFTEELEGRPLLIDAESGLPLIKADFELLVQVLANLIDNAIKYSPDGSEVRIMARSDADAVLLGVDDKGPGVPDEDKPRIFDKFYRLKAPGLERGTGLGLSICRAIIEAHGGKITVDDLPAGGSRFLVMLPVDRLAPEDLLRESEER